MTITIKKILLVLIGIVLLQPSLGQKSYSLDTLCDLAIKNNKNLTLKKEKIKQAEYNQKSVRTQYLPNINIEGAYFKNFKNISLIDEDIFLPIGTKNGDNFIFSLDQINNKYEIRMGQIVLLDKSGNPFNPQTEPSKIQWKEYTTIPKEELTLDIQNTYIASINIIQPLFMGGKIIAYNKIASLKKQLAKYDLKNATEQLQYDVIQQYWKIISLQNKLRTIEASIKFLIQIEKDVTILIENGISTPNEQLTINVKRNEAEIAKFKVKNWIRLSKMALAQYCGLPIESDYILTDEEKVLKSDELPLETTIERVFSNRIEIQKLSIVKKIYKEQENIERSKMLPSISFLGTYLGTNPSCYNGFQKKFSFDWHLGITIKIPLLHWGENIYTLKVAKCESNIHNLTIENVKQQIELEVEQKYIQMIESKKKFEIASRNLEQANENLRIAQEGFREGIISSSNLLEAQTTWVKATSEQIDAQIEIKMSESNYQKVIGIINPSNNE